MRKEEYIYFEDAVVVETLPGATFKVRVKRPSKVPDTNADDIFIVCNLKTILIKKRVLIIKGDHVVIEVNPVDMYYDEESKALKGIIIQRK